MYFWSALAVIVAIMARAAVVPEGQDFGLAPLLGPLALGFMVAGWCHFDGRMRNKQPARIGLMGIVIAAPIGFPVYCLWSRGLRGALLLLQGLGVAIGAALVGSVAGLVATGQLGAS